jgi:hypothetical protein
MREDVYVASDYLVDFALRRRRVLWLPRRLLRTQGNGLGKHPAHRPGRLPHHGWRSRWVRTRSIFSVILFEEPVRRGVTGSVIDLGNAGILKRFSTTIKMLGRKILIYVHTTDRPQERDFEEYWCARSSRSRCRTRPGKPAPVRGGARAEHVHNSALEHLTFFTAAFGFMKALGQRYFSQHF